MGMYTELVLSTQIKDDPAVVEIIKFMGGDGQVTPNPTFELPDHPFFKADRWKHMLRSASYYFTPMTAFRFERDDIAKSWSLIVRCDLKNYDDEIEKFIDWLSPHLDDHHGQMIGYSRYEESREPTILYAPGGEDEE
jgi:hypothetical protein